MGNEKGLYDREQWLMWTRASRQNMYCSSLSILNNHWEY